MPSWLAGAALGLVCDSAQSLGAIGEALIGYPGFRFQDVRECARAALRAAAKSSHQRKLRHLSARRAGDEQGIIARAGIQCSKTVIQSLSGPVSKPSRSAFVNSIRFSDILFEHKCQGEAEMLLHLMERIVGPADARLREQIRGNLPVLH